MSEKPNAINVENMQEQCQRIANAWSGSSNCHPFAMAHGTRAQISGENAAGEIVTFDRHALSRDRNALCIVTSPTQGRRTSGPTVQGTRGTIGARPTQHRRREGTSLTPSPCQPDTPPHGPRPGRGVVSNSRPIQGTGAGTTKQDRTELGFSMSGTELTPKTFDRMAVTERPTRTGIIWTLAAIGARIGVGPDFVRDTLATADGSPVREIGGRFFAFEDELIDFLKSDRNKPSKTL